MHEAARRVGRGCVPTIAVLLLFLLAKPVPAAPQGVVSRTPNITDGWVTSTGLLQFNFNHRFWSVPTDKGHRVLNSPSFLLAAPLPGRLLAGATYASNSQVSPDHFNEWEILLRWAPSIPASPVGFALTGAYNRAAGSADGELSVRVPLHLPESSPVDSISVLGAGRVLGDALDSGETGWFAGGGAVLHFGDRFAISADGGKLTVDGGDPKGVWGAALQIRIPRSPHTLALVASNTRTATLQGASVGSRTYWGFEFTIPVTP